MSDALILAALEAAAFETEEGERIIHTFAGGIGCDWDLASAREFVTTADSVEWIDGFAGHDLKVIKGQRRVVLQVPRAPQPADPAALIAAMEAILRGAKDEPRHATRRLILTLAEIELLVPALRASLANGDRS